MNQPRESSEASIVRLHIVQHAVDIGWTPISPDLAKEMRGGTAGMLFRDELAAKLSEFNPWMSHDAIQSIVETLDALPPTIEGNRDLLS